MKDSTPMLRLCYVKDQWAYFTPRTLEDQNGDDWDDAPYEHNAGAPYGDDIVKVAFDGDFDQPCTHGLNSPYSVDRINAGAIPWLTTASWSASPFVAIPGGCELSDFIRKIEMAGGCVYVAKNPIDESKK